MTSFITILLLFISFSTTIAQNNHYDLSEGVIRYYTDPCVSIGYACIATDFYNLGIETVLEDTTINEVKYQKVLWDWRYRWQSEPEESITEIEYFRFTNNILYKYQPEGDVVVQDYSFSAGDSLLPFFKHLEWDEYGLPEKVIYDTLTVFLDGSIHRVLWADNDSLFIPNHGYYNTEIPTAEKFIDSILVISDNSWTLPLGRTNNFESSNPFYFIDSIGVVYSWRNHRNMALVGISYPNGKLYGQKVELITSIESEKKKPSFLLHQNYPNPFDISTTIHFLLPNTSQVSLQIFIQR